MYAPQSQEEREYLDHYRPDRYDRPSVTVDIVVLTAGGEDGLAALLIKRSGHPYKGKLAFPGGFVGIKESVEEAAARVLAAETGIESLPLMQLYTFGAVDRDPRMRVISVAYLALVPTGRLSGRKAGAELYSVTEPLYRELAFDHADILRMAEKRLRGRLDYTDDVLCFVRDERSFTVQEVRRIYEDIRGTDVDPGNFQRMFSRRFLATGLVEPTGELMQNVTKKAKTYRRIKK